MLGVCLVWFGLGWSGLVWFGLVWPGLVWSGFGSCGFASVLVRRVEKDICLRYMISRYDSIKASTSALI